MGLSTHIQLQSTIKRLQEPISSEIDDELVILSIERGRYYGTGLVGQRIWALLAEPTRVGCLCDTLIAEFEVGRDLCEQEVLAFLGQLQQEGLIEIE